jgi:futalosine hydrolase
VILLACAVEAELGFWEPRADVTTLVTGVGPVEASCTLAAALSHGRYHLLVNAGLAGAFDGFAAIGDGVVVANEAIELDLESGAPLALPLGAKIVDRTSSDRTLVAQLRAKGFAARNGITVSRVTSTETTARRLARRLGAQVESMEGFAALRAAELAGIPAIELRGISNRCGDRDTSGWDFGAGLAGLQRVVTALFEDLQ